MSHPHLKASHPLSAGPLDVSDQALARVVLKAVEEERRRIAQELHDSLCQSLGGIQLLMRVISNDSGSDHSSGVKVAELGEMLARAAAELRELVFSLRAADSGVQDLPVSLRKLAEQVSQSVRCTSECEENTAVKDAFLALQLWLIAEAAARRLRTQTGLREIQIVLRPTPEDLVLSVCGEGAASEDLEPAAWPEWRLLELRAQAIGAELTLETSADGSPRLTCLIRRG